MIIIFNGPPGTGKDAAASFSKKYGYNSLSFKYQLFKETIAYFGVDYNWFMNGYDNREIKERPESMLQGMSRREALIYVSEEYIKPLHGQDFFGVQVANEIDLNKNYAISDGGFSEELVPIINKVGEQNILLVQLTRRGCDYSSDSRRYFNGRLENEYVIQHKTSIDPKHILSEKFNIKTYRVHNNGSLDQFYDVLQNIFQQIKKEEHEGESIKKNLSRESV